MQTKPWVASLTVGAGLGASAAFGVAWLLVAVQAVMAGFIESEVESGEQIFPAHVVAAGTAMGMFLLVSAGIALLRTSRPWAWAAALALVPSSLAWRWDYSARHWSWIGLAVAVLLARALLIRGTEAERRPAGRWWRIAAGVPAAMLLVLALPAAVDAVHGVLSGDADLMVRHVESDSQLGWALMGFALTGAAAGVLREVARRPVRRREDEPVPVG